MKTAIEYMYEEIVRRLSKEAREELIKLMINKEKMNIKENIFIRYKNVLKKLVDEHIELHYQLASEENRATGINEYDYIIEAKQILKSLQGK